MFDVKLRLEMRKARRALEKVEREAVTVTRDIVDRDEHEVSLQCACLSPRQPKQDFHSLAIHRLSLFRGQTPLKWASASSQA